VLNESHWPIAGSQKFPLLLGSALLNAQQTFQKFYDSTTEKRRLQWLYNYGTVTIAGRFVNSKLPIQLVVTPLQVRQQRNPSSSLFSSLSLCLFLSFLFFLI
jgi:hypothetical protein